MKSSIEKLIMTAVAAMLFCGAVTAQETEDSEQIVLPDVSSTIEQAEITIDPDAIPDFTLVLPLERTGLPVIRQLEVTDAGFDSFTLAPETESAKDIFMEASLGIGFRSSFAGDFSVYRSTGTVPFTLSFTHETVNGYGTHSASEGYNNSETAIAGDAAFNVTDLLRISGNASYDSGAYGLQGKSSTYYNMNHETATLNGLVTYQITPIIMISGGVDVLYNCQFASLSLKKDDDNWDAAYSASRNAGMWFDPYAGFTVGGDIWSVDLTARYAAGSEQSRTEAGLQFSGVWFDAVETDVSAGIVIATNSTTQTVYPFSIKIAAAPSLPFALSAEGGLKSAKTDLVALQAAYPYMFSGSRQYEESEWYGRVSFQTAIREYGFVTAGADFEKTAFGNGRLLPSATKDSQGLYVNGLRDITAFNTSVGIAVPFNLIAFSADWNVSWLDVVKPGPANALGTGVSYTSESGRFGGETDITMALSGNGMPYWNLSGFYRVSSAAKLELAGSDVLYLFTDHTTGTDYISRGGAVTISAHVYF